MPRPPKQVKRLSDYGESREGAAVTLAALFKDFCDLHVKVKRKPATLYSYERIFDGSVLPFFGAQLLASKVGPRELGVYVSSLSEAGLAPKTINDRVGALRACLTWGEGHGYDVRSPFYEKLPEQERKVDRTLSPAEVKTLAAAFKEGVFRRMFLVAVHTGLRNGELRAMRWEDVHWRPRVLDVRRSLPTGAYIAPVDQAGTPKGGVVRDLPMHADLLRVLQAQRRVSTGDGLLWVGDDGKPFTRRQTYTAIVNAGKVAGPKYAGVHWHTLRHTFATTLAGAGVPRIILQALLGHTDSRLTDRYSHVQKHRYDAATEALNGLFL